MKNIGWVLILFLAILQVVCAMEILELSAIVKRVVSIDEKTAILKNEAAIKVLEAEQMRAEYYRVFSTSPFKLTEEEARGIIKKGRVDDNVWQKDRR